MKLEWKIKRIDEGEREDLSECLLEIKGKAVCDGEEAGSFAGYYVLGEELDSAAAFWELWDMVGEACKVHEEIMRADREGFREPLPRLLENAPGILVVEYVMVLPAFRGMGLGRELIRSIVREGADERVGAVLLDADPLQHRSWAFDHFNEELRDLPFNAVATDQGKMAHLLRTWGMHQLRGTRYMVAPPGTLSDDAAPSWPPAPVAEW